MIYILPGLRTFGTDSLFLVFRPSGWSVNFVAPEKTLTKEIKSYENQALPASDKAFISNIHSFLDTN